MARYQTDSVSRSELGAEADNVFRQGMKEIAASEERGDKPVKLFGLIEVPAGAAIFGKIGYNALSQFGADRLQQPIYEHTHKLLGEHLSKLTGKQLSAGVLGKAAAGTTIAATLGMKAGGYVLPFFTSVVDQQKEQASTARKISSVLDDLKGNHSQLAFMLVNASDNSVIGAHKKRMDAVYGSKRLAQVTDLVFNAGANILLDVKQGAAMWKNGMSPDAINARLHIKPELSEQAFDPDMAALNSAREHKKEKSKEMLGYLWTTGGSLVSDVFAASGRRKQKAMLSKPSTLEMIVALEEQVSHNPNARVQPPGEHRDYSLEAYVMKVFLNHQREMADMDSNYSEIRPALREELAEAAQPIADAIRKGDISALSLMHLVGEPKKYPIVLNKGRALASGDDVASIVEKLAGKKIHTRMVNVDDFLAQHNLKIENLKKGIGEVKGDERVKLLALFPDSVLEQAGVKDEELKKVKEYRASPDYEQMLGTLATALAHEDEKALKQGGLSSKQITRLDEAAEKLKDDHAAVRDLKSSFTNPNGIESEIIDWALPQLEGKVLHLGKMLQRGSQLLANKDATPLPTRSFAEKMTEKQEHAAEALSEIADEFPAKEGGHVDRHHARESRGHDDGYGVDY